MGLKRSAISPHLSFFTQFNILPTTVILSASAFEGERKIYLVRKSFVEGGTTLGMTICTLKEIHNERD